MKKSNHVAVKSFADSIKGLSVIIKRRAAKHKQPIVVSQDGIAYFIYAKGRKVKIPD